ncbi:MAG: AAA family ATPase [Chloroflexota bacterium]|nr:AAA family ATPase [Chloroflexota bacterium]
MAANGTWQETMPGAEKSQSVYSYQELLAVNLPPERPLIAGLMGEETGNIWGGPGGVGKSWLVMAAARAIASGTPFLDHFPTTQHAVLIVDEENRLRNLQARARMFENAAPLGNIPITFAVGMGLRVDAAAELDQLNALMTEHRPGLVVLDSLTRVHGANENSAGEMANVFFYTKALMRAHKCAVLFTDHTRKKGLNNDPAETLRGTSEKRAWPETILDVAADEQERDRLVITTTKSREAETGVPFGIQREVDNIAGTARLLYVGEATQQKAGTGGEIIQAIHAIKSQLGDDGSDATALGAWMNRHPDTVRKHASKMATAGLLRTRIVPASVKGGKPKTVYDVAGGHEW